MKMKLDIKSATNALVGKADLPSQFSELIRPDLIKKAVEILQANRRQPYGSDPMAGRKASAKLSRRRRDYKTSYGIGISRVPRKVLSRRGTRFNWVGAVASGTVGGAEAHPPRAEKIWKKSINKKENRKAIRSAMAATVIKGIVAKRGHKVPESYPFLIDNKFEDLSKAKDVNVALEKLGLTEELSRSAEKKIRAGRGKMRGRKYKGKKGPLIVVSRQCPLIYSAENIPGVNVVVVQNLNAEMLAPGANAGRLTLYTAGAVERLAKEGLFTQNYKGEAIKKKSAEMKEKKEADAKKQPKQAKKAPEKKAEKETGKAKTRK